MSFSDGSSDPGLDHDFDADDTVDYIANHAIFIVIMGVSGTGKSTLGAALSQALRMPFIDGDDLHPKSNVEKMSRGEALTDADRAPWLEIIRTTAHQRIQAQLGSHVTESLEPDSKPETDKAWVEHREQAGESSSHQMQENGFAHKPGVLVACSALKKNYRELLRGAEKSGAVASHHVAPHPHELPTYFVFMKGSKEVLVDRMEKRKGHFMKTKMLESQLATLESPEEEAGVITVSIEDSTEEQVRKIIEGLEKMTGERY